MLFFYFFSFFRLRHNKEKIITGYGHKKTTIVAVTFSCLSALILTCGQSYAQTSGGGYAGSYLLRNVGARAISMAGAYTAVSNEPSAIFYNPAGLGLLTTKPTISSMYSFLDYGRSHSSVAWGQRFTDNLGFGFGINNFNGGSFTARDTRGNPLGNYQDRQISLTGGASYSIEFASVGVGVKYLLDALEGSAVRGDGFSVDIGTKFNVMDMFSFGITVQNIAGIMYWNKGSSETSILPFTVRTGVAMEYGLNEGKTSTAAKADGSIEEIYTAPTRYLLFSMDAVISQHENFPTISLGAEAVLHEALAVRGGIALAGDLEGKFILFPMTTWGTGISIRPPLRDLPFNTQIDYSIGADILANSRVGHHISLQFEF